jgi:hypothetical protein
LERKKNYNKTSFAPLWEGNNMILSMLTIGLCNGHIGLFPFTCIGVKYTDLGLQAPVEPAVNTMFKNVWSIVNKDKTEAPIEEKSDFDDWYDSNDIQGKEIGIALYDYPSTVNGDLEFKAHDKIEILKISDDLWHSVCT